MHKKKPAKSGFQTSPSGLGIKPAFGFSRLLSHEYGNKGQQENQNRTSQRNDNWNVFHDRFNWIVRSL
jgi:hypothetical protein